MPVVDGNRRVNLEPYRDAHCADKRSVRKNFQITNGLSLGARGKTIRKVQSDMALVREHFGLNISDSLRIALHLTAKAIRANKSLPDVRR